MLTREMNWHAFIKNKRSWKTRPPVSIKFCSLALSTNGKTTSRSHAVRAGACKFGLVRFPDRNDDIQVLNSLTMQDISILKNCSLV